MTGEITDAVFDEDTGWIEYDFELDDGTKGSGALTKHPASGTLLTDDAMRQLADSMVGTELKGLDGEQLKGRVFRAVDVVSVGFDFDPDAVDAFDSDRDRDFSRLANWIEDELDVDHSTASDMADAALDVKYGGDGE